MENRSDVGKLTDERGLTQALLDAAIGSASSASLERLAEWRKSNPANPGSAEADNCNTSVRVAGGHSANCNIANCNTPGS